MRLGLVVIVLAGCAPPASVGPVWPKPTLREIDGGESLAPRPPPRAITASVGDDKPSDRTGSDKPAAPSPASSGGSAADKPAAASAAISSPPDDPTLTDDIVIEIDD